MIALSKGIYGKLSGSLLSAHIGNRLFKIQAPAGSEYPYAVYKILNDIPEYPGPQTIEKFDIQFSLFSSKASSTEVENMLTDLWTLYDDCVLTVAGYLPIYFIRGNLNEMREDHITRSGTMGVYHYAQDYDGWIVKD